MTLTLWLPATNGSFQQRLSQYFVRWVRSLESRALPNCALQWRAASSHPQVKMKRCFPTLSPLTGLRLWIQVVSLLCLLQLTVGFNPAVAQSPTPSATPQPTTSPASFNPTDLIPTEIMACPVTGQLEWLELYNQGATTATITNWKIEDASGNIKTISSTIAPKNYAVIEWSGSLLNNTGDTLALWTNTGQLLVVAELGSCAAGQSFVLVNDYWQLSNSPTPGAVNPAPTPSPPSSASPQPSSTPNSSPRVITGASPSPTNIPTSTTNLSSVSPIPSSTAIPTPSLAAANTANYLQRLQRSMSTTNKSEPNTTKTSSSSATLVNESNQEPPTLQVLPPDEPLYPELQAAIGSAILGGSVVAGLGVYLLYAEINRLRQAAPPPLDLPSDSLLVDLN